MDLLGEHKYIGVSGKFKAILHPAIPVARADRPSVNPQPVWYVDFHSGGAWDCVPYKIGEPKIKESIARRGYAIDDLKWEEQKSDLFLVSPWTEPAAEKTELVYFIEAMGSNRIKIGITDSLFSRLAIIKTYCPFTPVIIGCVFGYKEMEEEIHHKFKHLRKNGEWFEGTEELREYIRHVTKGEVMPEAW